MTRLGLALGTTRASDHGAYGCPLGVGGEPLTLSERCGVLWRAVLALLLLLLPPSVKLRSSRLTRHSLTQSQGLQGWSQDHRGPMEARLDKFRDRAFLT